MSNLNSRFKNASDEMLTRMLRRLPQRLPPAGLTTALRVTASRAREQRSIWAALRQWSERVQWEIGNFVGSLALPAAGGVFSAVFLLGLWVIPTYPVHADSSFDVPTMLTPNSWTGTATEAALKTTGPVAGAGSDVVVDVTIDDRGRIVEYSLVSGPASAQDPDFRRRLENLLLFTEFVPATAFGKPGASRMRLTLLSSSVDVRG
jgi:hypothetical protein